MSTDETYRGEEILAAHRKKLQELETQSSSYGPNTPTQLISEIENLKSQIAKEEQELALVTERRRLEDELADLFLGQSIDLGELIRGSGFIDERTETKQKIESLLQEMFEFEKKLEDEEGAIIDSPGWYRVMAKGFALTENWVSAAKYYDKYVEYDADNWEVHYLRGVAYQNSRLGRDTNLAALRAYNETIALAPDDIDDNVRARLYGYRGAALKRLDRLVEAENDLLLAQRWAREQYEVYDIAYNLACVYAKTRQRKKMLEQLRPLVKQLQWRRIIRTQQTYFGNYWDDPEFQRLILLGE
jgi:tetratricopeptide (TPR) repeat protein